MNKYINLLNGYKLGATELDLIMLDASMHALLQGILPNDLRIKTSLVLGKTSILPEETDFLALETEVNKTILKDTVEALLEDKAVSLGYDSIISARSYAGFVNAYQVEALKLANWSASCWEVVDAVHLAVTTGTRTVPTEAELLLELPVYV